MVVSTIFLLPVWHCKVAIELEMEQITESWSPQFRKLSSPPVHPLSISKYEEVLCSDAKISKPAIAPEYKIV